MLIDTHVHLDAAEFDPDRPQVIAAARAAGVAGFVLPAVGRGNFDGVRQLAESNAGMCCALGIHPLYVMSSHIEDVDVLDQRLGEGWAVAVGEIGLDHFVEGIDRQRQLEFFVAQLALARRHALPVILHVRRAVDPILKQLRRIGVPGGIAHAFNGSRQQADAFIGMGFKLGFGGTMSFSGSTRIRGLAATLPLDSIVLETDAPDIPPEWAQGGRNEPANLPRYARILAELRGIDAGEAIEATGRNAMQALRWKP
ncbi:TatD family hydrolase [Thauera linaloolentis]|uniref:TatD-related deoxyribonuclease n=1 Tax=Thauera linaloolentis (strain DSM 12138 / JCM 21573 / CCUG 41526 / CIP 105981 / IAM 15112 / NBRC 102519 / 47Lol) TaxID=1123367 RepID=N6Z0K9_THAL4|nr:TatD family hydrolase [Thauera linaloolentis]ENO87913.1 TatD-related deoxyribonuclease [Thauera linaloolentis 47Lol = DSM 12138]MCM8567553.1 TatD family hydrolase [Thauera linaloolentis]